MKILNPVFRSIAPETPQFPQPQEKPSKKVMLRV